MQDDSLIPEKEDQYVEFKERPSDLEREIVAFANQSGGRIFIGVDDEGCVRGFQPSNRQRSQLIQAISNCDPRPQFEIKEYEHHTVLHIFEGTDKPYKAPGGFYLRLGATSQKLNRDEILGFFIKANQVHFDTQVVASVEHLGPSEYLDFNEIDSFRGMRSFLAAMATSELLSNFSLIRERKYRYDITAAAILLFAKNPQHWFPQSRIILWQMTSETDIADQKILTGTLPKQLFGAFAYLKSNLRTQYKIVGIQREEHPEFPEAVLREMVLNQIIHRNYFERGADTQIKIFPDKVEFSNPALLPEGKLPIDMYGTSYRRNPLLAETFQRVGFIDRAGTGLLRVRKLLEQEGLTPPILTQEAMYFIATLPRRGLADLSPLSIHGDASHSKQRILKLLGQGQALSSRDIGAILSIPIRTVRAKLADLVEEQLVKRSKEGRNVLYTSRQ